MPVGGLGNCLVSCGEQESEQPLAPVSLSALCHLPAGSRVFVRRFVSRVATGEIAERHRGFSRKRNSGTEGGLLTKRQLKQVRSSAQCSHRCVREHYECTLGYGRRLTHLSSTVPALCTHHPTRCRFGKRHVSTPCVFLLRRTTGSCHANPQVRLDIDSDGMTPLVALFVAYNEH